VNKYRLVFLPTESTPLLANLDELSRQGWEFVAWNTGPLDSIPQSRQALIRQSSEPTR
jgi:hypothetical protein